MHILEPWVLPITIGFTLIGAAFLFLLFRTRSREDENTIPRGRSFGATEIRCTSCTNTMVITLEDTRPLIPAEKALLVREHPQSLRKNVVEATCPYCESNHCFIAEGNALIWLCANANSPEEQSSCCAECRKSLRKPPWQAGEYDGRFSEAPILDGDFALICDRCGAICCLDCAEKHNFHAKEEAYECPRCFRKGLKNFYHG